MCDSCEELSINGTNCHEQGCPDAWKDYDNECKGCGSNFKPECKGQECCSESCQEAYYS